MATKLLRSRFPSWSVVIFVAALTSLASAQPRLGEPFRGPGPRPLRPAGPAIPQPAPAAPEPVVEGGVVVAFLNLDRSPIGTLVEAKLRAKKIVNWWPRIAAAKLLDDLELSTAIDIPPLPSENSEPPKLPDALILCRTRIQEKDRLCEIVVCEPGLGLRLGTARLTLTKEIGADVNKLTDAAVRALSKLGEPMKELWGIPPLRSKDLGSKYDSLRTQLASLVEEELLRRKGAFAVELDYAHAIALARQHCGLTEPIKRTTPIYLTGQYRNSGDGDKRTLAITLQVVGSDAANSPTNLPPADAENALREKAKSIAKEVGGSQETGENETSEEFRLLGNLAKEFQKSGDASGHLVILETSLLLKLGDFAAQQESLLLIGQRVRFHWDQGRDVVAFRQVTEVLPGGGSVVKNVPNEQAEVQIQEGLTAMNLYRRGLTRLREQLELGPAGTGPDRTVSPVEFMLSFQGVTPRPEVPRSYQAVAQRLSHEQREVALLFARREAKQGIANALLVWGESTTQERMQLVLRLIVELQNEPQVENRTMSYLHNSVGLPNLKTPEGEEFLQQLAEIPHPAVQAALTKIKDQVAKYEIPKATAPMPQAEEEEKNADVRFVPLSLGWKDLPATQPELKAFCEMVVPVGKEGDLFCGDGQVLLMKKKGETKLLFDAKGQGYSFKQTGGHGISPAFGGYDGRYAWLPMMSYGKPSRLLIVDPEKETAREFKAEEGLPSEVPEKNSVPILAAAPLSPGTALLCGSFGKTWLGVATYGGEKPSLKIIHEAQDAPLRNNREQWRNTSLTFSPSYMFALSERAGDKEKPARRVIVGRASNDGETFSHPLLVDPDSGKVEVLQTRLNPGQTGLMTVDDGSLYWVQHSSGNQMMAAEFMRLGFPDFEPTSLGKQPLPGKGYQLALGMEEKGVIVFHDQWLTAERPGDPLRPIKGNLPKNERTSPRFLVHSNHYGWILLVSNFNRGYAVEIKK